MKEQKYPSIGERLYFDTLENGLRIFVVPKPGYSKAYAFFATNYGGADRRFKLAGEWHDTPGGVAHFLEHKMFDMPEGNALGLLSAKGADPNAFTSSGMTAYHFQSTEHFYENLETLLGFVSTPYFTPESVEKEQGIIGQEIRMTEDSPDHALYYGLLKCLFRHNPVADAVVGTAESIAEITEETLYNCHRVFYNPSNMALCVVGDVEPERIRETAERILPREPGERPERDYGQAEAELPYCARRETEMEVSMPMFAMGSRFDPVPAGREALKQRIAGDLALDCLLGDSSPLYNRLYGEGLINGSFFLEAEYTAGTGILMILGESKDPERVYEEICVEAERAMARGLDPERFERIRRADYGSRLRSLGRFGDLAYDIISGAFAGFDAMEAIDAAAEVSKADAEAFIRNTLRREKLALSLVRPRTGEVAE